MSVWNALSRSLVMTEPVLISEPRLREIEKLTVMVKKL